MSPDLVVFSHLRWNWVWQRPQHLISRLAKGRRTWFVEEPLPADVEEPRIRAAADGPVTRVWLEVPDTCGPMGFDQQHVPLYEELLPTVLPRMKDPTVWLYTPMTYELAMSLQPQVTVYDVMDDLSSFLGAPPELKLRHLRALRDVDVVFTGGRSLYHAVRQHRADAHLFPSGVEPEHFAPARTLRGRHHRPVAGYVGVIDERLDLGLIAGLAGALPDWEIQLVGPIAKIDPAEVPVAPNITLTGPRPYDALPEVLAGFDVALMPFALNQATKSISPTKTLEYLAAGLRVVSTRVPDVVADHSANVDLRDDAAGFADACVAAIGLPPRTDAALEHLLRAHRWDTIAERMASLLEEQADERAVNWTG